MQEGSLVLKCFQLLADALNQNQTLEQVLVPSFHRQIEAMLKSMSESKVIPLLAHSLARSLTHASTQPCMHYISLADLRCGCGC